MLQCSSGILAVFQRMSASSATRPQMQLHFNTLAIALSCFAQLVLLTVGWFQAGGRPTPTHHSLALLTDVLLLCLSNLCADGIHTRI